MFVTGGAGGIGKAIVEAFCKLNYQVAFCDKNELKGQQTAQATGAQFYPVDLNSKEALELCLQNIFKEWGDIDIIINNAGISEFSPITETSVETFDKILSVNLVRCSLLHMRWQYTAKVKTTRIPTEESLISVLRAI